MLKLTQICLALALALSGVFVAGGTDGHVAFAAGSPPACRYDDVVTRYTSPADWQKTLIDSTYELPRSYMPPPGLVSTANAGLNGAQRVRRFLIADLTALAKAARNAGVPLRVISGYRSYAKQDYLYRKEVRNKGLEEGRLRVARPGHSEHHLGTTLDFGSAANQTPGWRYDDWADTPTGAWLKANAWRHGFVMSYPDGSQEVTCYQYEPWHWRYVGRDMAAKIHVARTTLREYLWHNFY